MHSPTIALFMEDRDMRAILQRNSRVLAGLWQLIPAALIFCSLTSPISADSAETWRPRLEQQLHAQEKCVLTLLSGVSESGEGSTLSVKARAHCEDNRSFDVQLAPGSKKFEISACKPTYC